MRWIARKANTQLIYNCVNIAENSNIKVVKENLVLTVGLIDSERTFYLKGIDTFTEVAQLLPELKFMVIGMNKNLQDRLLKNLSENVEIIERVNHSELETYYKKAKVYCQFSRTESFGVAIVEAINFGCIPVVTNVGGMPELIGNSGFIVKRESAKISQLIKDSVIGFQNSKTVTFNYQLFSVESRSKLILKALAELI